MGLPREKLQHRARKAPEKQAKYKLDELDASRVAKYLVMFHPTEAEVANLLALARLAIPGMAETKDVIDVFRHNHDSILAFARRSRFDDSAPVGEGMIAMLMLNTLGLQHLALGTLNTARPDQRLLVKPGERPAGIYMWCAFAPGPLAGSVALMMAKMSSEQYRGVDMYARTATTDGERFVEVLGFTKGVKIGEIEAPNIWIFPRKTQSPLYDTYIPGAAPGEVGITVARSFDDLMKVLAVRNAVYVSEQECPYDEEYDGNDLSATHLLAYIGDEPVGCLRLRFFADFAKFERMAIRKEFRKSRAAIHLARAGFKFCQKKGYTRVYGHIQERLVPFWSRFGFRPRENGRKFVFSDFEYIEIVAEVERDPEAVTLDADPYLIIRPEGRWHVSGILEHSAHRPITSPSFGNAKR